jgi:hypothetical protein
VKTNLGSASWWTSGTSAARSCSTFALDVYWTSRRRGAPHLVRHVEECARCREYLAMLDDVDATPLAEDATSIRVRPRTQEPRGVLARVTLALAFAAGVGVFVESALQTPAKPTYVGVKGTPSVQLLVHRGNETAIWDGRSPVHAGDAIAVRAACGALGNVSVAADHASHGARGQWARLSDALCPKSDAVLPFTLIVDGLSEDEHIAVVMSDARLSDDELGRAVDDSERSPHVWVVRFVIPEERP